MLPFKFHLIKPKEKKPLSLSLLLWRAPPPAHDSLSSHRSSVPPLLLSQGGGRHTSNPSPSSYVFPLPVDPSSHPSSENHHIPTGDPVQHGAGKRWVVELGAVLAWGPGAQDQGQSAPPLPHQRWPFTLSLFPTQWPEEMSENRSESLADPNARGRSWESGAL